MGKSYLIRIFCTLKLIYHCCGTHKGQRLYREGLECIFFLSIFAGGAYKCKCTFSREMDVYKVMLMPPFPTSNGRYYCSFSACCSLPFVEMSPLILLFTFCSYTGPDHQSNAPVTTARRAVQCKNAFSPSFSTQHQCCIITKFELKLHKVQSEGQL